MHPRNHNDTVVQASRRMHPYRADHGGMRRGCRGDSCRRRCGGGDRNARMLQRHGSACTNISELADSGATSLRLRLAIGIGLGVECLVGSYVADRPRRLVSEACEGEGLADL